MDIINIEEIRASDRLKKEKCEKAKAAIKEILPEDQIEKFDKIFDSVMDKVFKGVLLIEKNWMCQRKFNREFWLRMKAVFSNGYGFFFLGGMLVDITVSVISSVVERRRVEFNLKPS